MQKLKKTFVAILVSFLFFFSFTTITNASTISVVKNELRIVQPAATTNDTCSCGESDCDSVFGDPTCDQCPAYWLQFAFNIMKYVAIVALFVLVIADFFKALVASDNKALTKAAQTAVKRFVFCVLIFFLPMIIGLIMELFGAYGTCGIG